MRSDDGILLQIKMFLNVTYKDCYCDLEIFFKVEIVDGEIYFEKLPLKFEVSS